MLRVAVMLSLRDDHDSVSALKLLLSPDHLPGKEIRFQIKFLQEQ